MRDQRRVACAGPAGRLGEGGARMSKEASEIGESVEVNAGGWSGENATRGLFSR